MLLPSASHKSQRPRLEVLISCPDAPEAHWQVARLQLEEAINDPYSEQLVLESEELDANAHELLGATCELTLSRGERGSRALFGVVARVDYLGYNDHLQHCVPTVVPAFTLARQRPNSRIWQQQSRSRRSSSKCSPPCLKAADGVR